MKSFAYMFSLAALLCVPRAFAGSVTTSLTNITNVYKANAGNMYDKNGTHYYAININDNVFNYYFTGSNDGKYRSTICYNYAESILNQGGSGATLTVEYALDSNGVFLVSSCRCSGSTCSNPKSLKVKVSVPH